MRDVQPHPSAGSAAALLDLGVGGQCDPIAGGQFHPLGVITFHEALTEVVAQDSALAASRLGYQCARGVLWLDQPGRMELDELRIADPPARLERQTERVTGVFVAARRRASPDPGMPTGSEDDGICMDLVAGPVLQVKAVRTEDDVVSDEQLW